ncbi:MAG: acyltransferase [Verrucomicrobiota bacterium]|nr:acyltransferase [Verrucomicrobiota bacterium]
MADRFRNWRAPRIPDGRPTEWGWIVRHPGNFRLGRQTDIGAFTYINAKNGVTLEDEAQVGSHCSIYSISTIDGKEGPVVLKRNCRVGAHSVIMPGVTIGENTVVGAMSFVNKSLPANCVACGVPARVVRKRAGGKSRAAPVNHVNKRKMH